MPISKTQSAPGGAVLAAIFSAWAVAAGAQQDAAPPPPSGKPPMAAPAPQTSPETSPATSPAPSQKPQAAPPSETPAGTPAGRDLIGLSVFSSDGTRVGAVSAVSLGPNGNIAALHVKSGGFLGFGGRIVAIPEGAFARKGPDIRLDLSEEEVDNLPEMKEGN